MINIRFNQKKSFISKTTILAFKSKKNFQLLISHTSTTTTQIDFKPKKEKELYTEVIHSLTADRYNRLF